MSQSTPTITVDRLAERQADGTLIDVREGNEYVQAHIPGARLVPMGELPARVDELDRTRPVWVVCASGNRSQAMTDLLCARGFEAYSVADGTRDWMTSGRPVERGL
ncbi:rhodanese-like domain-containing protein [Nocardioides guangzhouensis]|uniref:Rhodanese-like domain-containing protein n=1 Tax=Nocardioides guangzhouensis TaxID=2497878 RepID=A0A4Q4ZKF5_9ACTN|nr:rhodanese-like domain-containing protein [Nocardioides guangzhouensis]RYP88355.1 rhodanese-like domain-containing protein [Nocardioides guangzhouensis]